MTGREPNPRRQVLQYLRLMARNVHTMVGTWDQYQSTQFDETGKWIGGRRPIPSEEKMENRAEQWDRLVEFMDTVIDQARQIRQYARFRAFAVREGRRW